MWPLETEHRAQEEGTDIETVGEDETMKLFISGLCSERDIKAKLTKPTNDLSTTYILKTHDSFQKYVY